MTSLSWSTLSRPRAGYPVYKARRAPGACMLQMCFGSTSLMLTRAALLYVRRACCEPRHAFYCAPCNCGRVIHLSLRVYARWACDLHVIPTLSQLRQSRPHTVHPVYLLKRAHSSCHCTSFSASAQRRPCRPAARRCVHAAQITICSPLSIAYLAIATE